MKLITTLRKPQKLEDVKKELYDAEVYKMTVSSVLGCGQQKGYEETFRGVITEINLLKKIRIDIAVNDGFKITGLKAQGDQLIVYKEKNRYYLSTFYESNTGVYGLRVSPFKDNAGGAIAHETIHVIKNGDIIALASQTLGVQGIGKQQAPDGSLLPNEYSRDIRPLFEQINCHFIYSVK